MMKNNHNIIPISISTQLTSSTHLPNEIIGICDKYYILYWESRYLYTQLIRTGRIIRQGISYTPHFLNELSVHKLSINLEMQVRVSFRRLRGKIGGDAVISLVPSISHKIHKDSNNVSST